MDVSGDILGFDNGTVEVTFTSHAGSRAISVFTMQAHEDQARPSNGIYRRYFKTYLVPEASATPVIRDTILDADGLWTVLKVSTPVLHGPQYCDCINLNFNGFLDTTITIYEPVYSTNAYGDKIMTPTVLAQALPARVQPGAGELHEQTVNGKKLFTHLFEIYVNYDIPKRTINTSIVDNTTGQRYMLADILGRETLEDFTILRCYQNV